MSFTVLQNIQFIQYRTNYTVDKRTDAQDTSRDRLIELYWRAGCLIQQLQTDRR